jgi:hypothetical protein
MSNPPESPRTRVLECWSIGRTEDCASFEPHPRSKVVFSVPTRDLRLESATMHHSITPSLLHSFTPSLLHSFTPPLHHSTTPFPPLHS